ncbi:MAG: alcohol dehydrogenase catalytic domain-containing protein [Candidatus Lokiarchaeota archaeon]|nr:alcohol dehydrogenase catalytic domain-containing protein [Candidatus Lokiarchaeota archaeon]
MKANVFYDIDDFRYEEIKTPDISEHEVLVEMKACGVCGTDIHKAIFKTVDTPIVLGHEVSGKIIKKGGKVKKFEIGDRVALAHHAPCMTCWECRHNHHSLCDEYLKTNLDPGGFSEIIRVPAVNVRLTMLKIPDNMSYEEGAFMEPLSCCLRGYSSKIQSGDSVLILGSGPIGIIHTQIAKAFNASLIINTDLVDYRLDIAEKFGAIGINVKSQNVIEKVMELTDNKGTDMIIDTVGNKNAMIEAIKSARKGATINVFAPFIKDSSINLNFDDIFFRELRIVGTYSSSPLDYPRVLRLIENEIINVKNLITHNFQLKYLQKAINLGHKAKKSLKIMINP